MKRDFHSTRSKKWFARNSLESSSCRSYVHNLCEINFEFDNFDIKPYNGTDVLFVSHGLYTYIVFADNVDVGLKILEKNSNTGRKDRYHSIDKMFYGDSCWYNCLDWIKNRK